MKFVSRLIVGALGTLLSLGASAQQPQPVGTDVAFNGIGRHPFRRGRESQGIVAPFRQVGVEQRTD